MTSSKRRIVSFVCLAGLLSFLAILLTSGHDEKKQMIIHDLIRDPQSVSIVVVATSRIPSSITSVVIGTVSAEGIVVFSGASNDVGRWGHVAEFDLTEELLFRGIPETIPREFGKFPFPSEYRTWEGKIAGFDAKVELYFDPKTRKFVAYVWNRQ